MKLKYTIATTAFALALSACETPPVATGYQEPEEYNYYEQDVQENQFDDSAFAEEGAAQVEDNIFEEEDELQDVPDRIYFDYDSSALDRESREVLDIQAAWLKSNPNIDVVVEGHCDERGTREYNLALGERRAQAAKNYLVASGVTPNRIRTISYGKERPAVLGSTPVAWSQNRRAVTVVAGNR